MKVNQTQLVNYITSVLKAYKVPYIDPCTGNQIGDCICDEETIDISCIEDDTCTTYTYGDGPVFGSECKGAEIEYTLTGTPVSSYLTISSFTINNNVYSVNKTVIINTEVVVFELKETLEILKEALVAEGIVFSEVSFSLIPSGFGVTLSTNFVGVDASMSEVVLKAILYYNDGTDQQLNQTNIINSAACPILDPKTTETVQAPLACNQWKVCDDCNYTGIQFFYTEGTNSGRANTINLNIFINEGINIADVRILAELPPNVAPAGTPNPVNLFDLSIPPLIQEPTTTGLTTYEDIPIGLLNIPFYLEVTDVNGCRYIKYATARDSITSPSWAIAAGPREITDADLVTPGSPKVVDVEHLMATAPLLPGTKVIYVGKGTLKNPDYIFVTLSDNTALVVKEVPVMRGANATITTMNLGANGDQQYVLYCTSGEAGTLCDFEVLWQNGNTDSALGQTTAVFTKPVLNDSAQGVVSITVTYSDGVQQILLVGYDNGASARVTLTTPDLFGLALVGLYPGQQMHDLNTAKTYAWDGAVWNPLW